jgi:N-methylhydantoinase A
MAIHKVSTPPDDPSAGVVEGILGLCRSADAVPGGVSHVLRGTTIAANNSPTRR